MPTAVKRVTCLFALITAFSPVGLSASVARSGGLAIGVSRSQPTAVVFLSDRTGRSVPYADNLAASALTPLAKAFPAYARTTDSSAVAWSPGGSKVAIG